MTTIYLQTITDKMINICRVGYIKKDGSFQPYPYYLRKSPLSIRIDAGDNISTIPQGRVINQ